MITAVNRRASKATTFSGTSISWPHHKGESLNLTIAERKELAELDLDEEEDDDAPIKAKSDKKKVEKKFGATAYDKEVLSVAADYVRLAKPQTAAQRN